MYSCCDTDLTVGGFPHSDISGSQDCCRLPEAFRRLTRLSSPLTAKASTMCTSLLDHTTPNSRIHPTSGNGETYLVSCQQTCAYQQYNRLWLPKRLIQFVRLFDLATDQTNNFTSDSIANLLKIRLRSRRSTTSFYNHVTLHYCEVDTISRG